MKIDKTTFDTLKNFASINNGLVVKKGTTISTRNVGKTVVAKAVLKEAFEEDFALYDLNRFLGTLSLFPMGEVDILLGEKSLKIVSKHQSVVYTYCDPEFLLPPMEKEIKMSSDVDFSLRAGDLQALFKASSVMKLPNLAFTGDGSAIFVQGLDSKNPTGDVFSLEVGETSKKFRFVFKTENFKMSNGVDYRVDVASKGVAKFTGPDIVYWIAVERELSSFDGK